MADTCCEVIVLSREDIDEVLRSFPILQAQMEKVEANDAYRKYVLDAIANRKSNAPSG